MQTTKAKTMASKNEWRTKTNPNAYFITLTIDDENYTNLANICDSDNDNEIATKEIRLTLERIRKKQEKV